MNKILVIVVTYNAMQWAERCFDSLRKSSVKPDVYVVDNGSTDGTQDYVQHNYPEIKFVQSHENLGFGKANNMGLRYALQNNYDYVYLLNQDAWVFPDTFEDLIEISKKYPEFAILSPMQMQANLIHMDRNFSNILVNNRDFIDDSFLGKLNDVYPVENVMAAHWLLPINKLKVIGLFSPSFSHYCEDDNLCNRVAYHNFKVGVVPAAKAVHDREFRNYNRNNEIRKRYVCNINIVSRIQNRARHPYMQSLKETIRLCKNLRTFKAIPDFIRFIIKRKDWDVNMKESMREGAFINI